MKDNFVITAIDRVIMVGKDEYASNRLTFPATLKSNELIFHFSGHDTVYFGDLVMEIKAGAVRFLPKGEGTHYEVVRHERGECIDVFFQTDRPVAEGAFVLHAAQSEKLGTLFKKLFAVWAGRGNGYYFEAISVLYKIFAELQGGDPAPKQHTVKIKPAVDLMHDRFLREPLSVAELAAACGMKESYFERLFKEKYGMPPKKYMVWLKLNHACELLRLERYSVTQVAELCCFSDVYFFSRQFKEYMGISPTQFVEKYRSSK